MARAQDDEGLALDASTQGTLDFLRGQKPVVFLLGEPSQGIVGAIGGGLGYGAVKAITSVEVTGTVTSVNHTYESFTEQPAVVIAMTVGGIVVPMLIGAFLPKKAKDDDE